MLHPAQRRPLYPMTFAIVAIGISFASLYGYIFHSYYPQFFADSAVKIQLAQEIIATGHLLPDSWHYVNGDLWVLASHLAALPLLLVLPVSFQLHAWAAFIASTLILYSLWLVSGIFTDITTRRVWAIACFAGGISPQVAENLYGQVSYGIILCLQCFLIFSLWRIIKPLPAQSRLRTLSYATQLTLLIIATSWSNPVRGTIYYLLPAVAALLYYNRLQPIDRRLLRNILISVVAAWILGSIFYLASVQQAPELPKTFNNLAPESLHFLKPDQIIQSILIVPASVISIFGHIPQQVLSLSLSNISAIVLLLLAALASIIVFKISTKFKDLSAQSQMVVVFALVNLAPMLLLMSVSSIQGLARYLIPGVLLLILMALTVPYEQLHLSSQERQRLLPLLITALLLGMAPVHLNFTQETIVPYYIYQNRHAELGKRLLTEAAPTTGYAEFFDAGSLTILSNEQFKVAPITLGDGLPIPLAWLSSARWFAEDRPPAPSFLVLDHSRLALLDLKQLAGIGLKPTKVFDHERMRVFIFDRDIINALQQQRFINQTP